MSKRIHLPDGRAVLVFEDPDSDLRFSGVVTRRENDGKWYEEGRTRDYVITAPDFETAARRIADHVDAGLGAPPDLRYGRIALARLGDDDTDTD